ncbi:tail fiber domain-containing protein [Paracrocinitomix mangrovi]|uniref:tail fiber domain-containing protein n=1 Tax=Paracrocinitomix mangrovi TaxID=2862509 RepID=UPI001C8E46AA|nr:tail fiber domain-containing protein [Paracrocinitomix mangrovi]UKN02512.1 tail fiber domain-containing protein [Paracrocinitomix mangrovi]
MIKFKYYLIGFVAFFATSSYSQGPNTGGANGNGQFWRLGGNSGTGPFGAGNIFGNQWDSPIYTICGAGGASNFRVKLNANQLPGTFYNVAGYGIASGINRTGYMLLGHMTGFSSGFLEPGGTPLGAYSLLHLNGRDGTFVQQGGYRPWMKTGITYTDNNDLSYVGIRKVGTGTDLTETVISWSDNATQPFPGPDDMVFRFTAGGPSTDGNIATAISATNLLTPADLDGLHIARFTGDGLFGLGNTFGTQGNGDPNVYVRPQSLQHLSLSNYRDVFTQYTNRNVAINSGTGEGTNDGLRVGILGENNVQRNGNALIYQQENKHLLLSTNASTNSASALNTRERVRITNYGAPTELAFNQYGTHNPANINANFTRMSISQNPNNPVTRPMSLLHIGYNTGGAFGLTTDGWRPWMDIGMFGSNGTDNFYMGLKNEGPDQFDAVVSWGDNQPAGANGPDHLRFIFTSTTTALPPGQGDPVSQSANGLEIGRFEPTQDVNNDPNSANFGKFGVGDFATTNQPVTHKLHVKGNARLEYVPDEATDYVLMARILDQNNPNDIDIRKVHIDSLPTAVIDTAFVNCDSTELVFVQNGDSLFIDMSCFVDSASASGITPCSDVSGASNMTEDSHITLNDFDLYFEDGADSLTQFTGNQIGIGYDCGENFPGKLSIDNKSEHVGLYVMNDGITDIGNWPNDYQAGITSIVRNSDITGVAQGSFLPAIYARSENNQPFNLGLLIETEVGNANTGAVINAGASGVPSANNTGVRVAAIEGSFVNVGGYFGASGAAGSFQSTGGTFSAGGSNTNYGIQASAPVGPNNFSGFFQGAPISVVGIVYPSDQNLKTNIVDYDSSLIVINQLDPKTFNYTNANFPGMVVETGHQYGLIAQEVEQILPALVTEVTSPAEYDTLGNVIVPAYTYKGLDYESFIPILIGGVKEQQSIIEEQDSVINVQDSLINDLNDRLTNLENCLSNILPLLCQINNSMVEQNDTKAQEQIRSLIDVELSDNQSIVLEQNVPNPFAERTVINFSIPETVQKAQIHFYNAAGQLIESVEITERGLGSLNVYGSDLSRGIYTYTLVADGNIVATKKMEKMGY